MKVAALDLGTNTFLCLIADVSDGKIIKVLDDQVQIVRLGQDVQKTGKFHPEAIQRARKALHDFSEIIKNQNGKNPVEKILAMATSAARDVSNGDELFNIGRELGIPIEIIPGDKEAEITYQGAISGQKNLQQSFVVVDVGGGSTELIYGHGSRTLFSRSLNVGCVRLTEAFLPQQPVAPEQLAKLKEKIRGEIASTADDILRQGKIDCLLAVAGTPTELAKIEIGKFDVEKIDGYKFTLEQLERWEQKFSGHSAQQISEKFSVNPGRADVILVGVLILQEVCRALGQAGIVVSTRGVRYGVALEIEKREKNRKATQ